MGEIEDAALVGHGAARDRERLAALDRTALLDTPPEPLFDDLARMAALSLGAPIAAVGLIAADRQWLKAETGLGFREIPISASVCVHAIQQRDDLVVPDMTQDPRFEGNPLTGEPLGLRFYAGAVLKSPEGLPLGTLFVLDTRPRPAGLSETERFMLRTLAQQVSSQIELRRVLAERDVLGRQQRSPRSPTRRSLDPMLELLPMLELMEKADGDLAEPHDRSRDLSLAPELSAASELSPAIVWFGMPDGSVGYLDQNWYDYSGQTLGQALHSGWTSAVHPFDLQRLLTTWQDARDGGQLYETESRLRRRDGVYRWFLIRAYPLHTASGTITGWLGNTIDIDDRRNAEQALRRTKSRLEQDVAERTLDRDRMWRLSADIMMVMGPRRRIKAVNPAWTDLLGWTEAELIGSSALTLLHPDDPAFARGPVRPGAQEAASTQRFENRVRHRDGSYRWISWAAVPDGVSMHAVGRDVTAEKEQAEALRQVEDALRQSQKMEAVGQLTGGLAHDFNNLLTGISGSLDLLQIRASQGRVSELEPYVTAAQSAASRAASLTHRLLAFSRRQTLDPQLTSVNAMVTGIEELIRRTVGSATLVETVLDADLGLVLCDQNQLENALLNLCINARDAMPEGGRLTIATANVQLDEAAARDREVPAGHYVTLHVTDTGTGMTPEVAARAFDPFFTTKPVGQGTGLGLSMIQGFARQSGGQVRICSKPGQGTTMWIYLPGHGNAGEPVPAIPPPAQGARTGSGEIVLVVDDEPVIRMLIGEVLEELGYAVIEASDATSGLEVLRSEARIDLLITDVGLPGGMNGRQLADAALSRRPGLKVLFVTGQANNAPPNQEPWPAGMQILMKPFTIDALTVRLRAIMAL